MTNYLKEPSEILRYGSCGELLCMARFVGLGSLIFLSGCFSSGNVRIMDESKSSQIKEGMTQEQVRELIGEPMTISSTNGIESWAYAYTEAQSNAASFIPVIGILAGGARTKSAMVVLGFDSDGKVKSVTRSNSTAKVNY